MKYIVFPGVLDIRMGGPAGYIGNLKKGLEEIERDNEVEIISRGENSRKLSIQHSSKIKKYIGNSDILTQLFLYNKSILNRDMKIRKEIKEKQFGYNDLIHVHNVLDYNKIKKYKSLSKIILTPHSPESISDEILNLTRKDYSNKKLNIKSIVKKCKSIERDAFRDCEYFIFPSKEAMEIYEEFIDDFSDIIKDKNVYYNLTGCRELEYKIERNDFRKKYKIPEDAFVVSYIGRHNKIKGFDILDQVAKQIEKINENIIFISGGTGDIESTSKNFIQLGWTDDPGSIVNASDLFILPNRSTYFDLVLLEVLSLGTPVIASNTGGNKTVAKLSDGVNLFESENIDEIVNSILDLTKDKEKLEAMKVSNLECYKNNFTLEKFAQRYINILKQIGEINA